MKIKDRTKFIEIFSGLGWQAQMVKNMLENEGIESYIKDEIIGTIAPWYINPGAGSVSVVISALDYDRARIIVDEYEKKQKD